jgi:hypothetical protein
MIEIVCKAGLGGGVYGIYLPSNRSLYDLDATMPCEIPPS